MRRDLTPAERLLWQRLRAKSLGAKLKRQVPFGPYILDFAFLAARMVVEIDGETHATDAARKADAARDRALRGRGFAILRFTNRDVLGNVEGVMEVILAALKGPLPGPLPKAGEGEDLLPLPPSGERRGEGAALG